VSFLVVVAEDETWQARVPVERTRQLQALAVRRSRMELVWRIDRRLRSLG
jgi:hypothetical protein